MSSPHPPCDSICPPTANASNRPWPRRPQLLVLDPHPPASHRRERRFQVAPLLRASCANSSASTNSPCSSWHHARKDAGGTRPGALRGSSEHGWGDSNLYLRRHKQSLTLTTEHRAPSADPRLSSWSTTALPWRWPSWAQFLPLGAPATVPVERVRQALAGAEGPLPVQQLRKLCSMRTATLCESLAQLTRQGLVVREPGGYQPRLPLDPRPPRLRYPFPILGTPRKRNALQFCPVKQKQALAEEQPAQDNWMATKRRSATTPGRSTSPPRHFGQTCRALSCLKNLPTQPQQHPFASLYRRPGQPKNLIPSITSKSSPSVIAALLIAAHPLRGETTHPVIQPRHFLLQSGDALLGRWLCLLSRGKQGADANCGQHHYETCNTIVHSGWGCIMPNALAQAQPPEAGVACKNDVRVSIDGKLPGVATAVCSVWFGLILRPLSSRVESPETRPADCPARKE